MIILFFTFQSAGLPVLLVLTIQGSIWINFAVPALQGQTVFFIAYLIVSAIQMGATIDYAIVISNRYLQLKKEMQLKDAMIETLNQSFPTIFTSGSILTCAGFLIGEIASDATVASIGVALGRGTLISIILVLFVASTDTFTWRYYYRKDSSYNEYCKTTERSCRQGKSYRTRQRLCTG